MDETVLRAIRAVRRHFEDGGFLSGPDYLSTGEVASPTNWGDPDVLSDFVKADKAMRLAREAQMQEQQGSEPAVQAQPDIFQRQVASRVLPETSEREVPVQIPFRQPEREFRMSDANVGPASFANQPLAYAPAQNQPLPAASDGSQIFPVIGTFVGGARSHYGAPRGTLGDYMRLHAGTDWQAENGTPVYSTTPGKVVYTGEHAGYGNMVDIAAPDGTIRRYAVHSGDINVEPGAQVKAGQPIGTVGGQHLHHEVIASKTPAYESAMRGEFGGTQRVGGREYTIDPAIVYGLKPRTQVYGPRGLVERADGGEVDDNNNDAVPYDADSVDFPVKLAMAETSTPGTAYDFAPVNLTVGNQTPVNPPADKFTMRVPQDPNSIPLTQKQADLVTRTIAAESGRKTPEESQAIANVIINRILSGKYGDSPEAVLLAKKQFESWGEPKSPNYAMKMLPGSPRYIEAQGNLEAALKSPDITGGATHFWSPAGQNALGRKPPKWSYTSPGVDIGATRFHKLSRADGGSVVNDALALVSGLI